MRYLVWLAAAGLFATALPEASAQLLPPRYGIGFRYNSGRLQIQGYLQRGYGVAPYYGYYAPGYAAPYGVIQSYHRTEIHATPQVIVLPPEQPKYDLRGVDLDLYRPDGTRREPTDREPAKQPDLPKKLPGPNVSVPKKAQRPTEPRPPVKPKIPQPPQRPPRLPKPKPPLPNPQDEADRQIARGVAAFNKGQYGLAAQRFQSAADVDPANPLSYFLRSQAEFALGRYREAAKSIEEGMKRRNDWPDAKFNPRVQLYKGREPAFEDHLKRLDEVVKQNPKSAALLFLAAHQRWFDGNRKQALELFRRARPLSRNPTYIDRFLNAGKGKVVAAR